MPSAVEMWRDGIQRQAYLPGMPPAHGTQATSHRLGIPETSKRDPRPVTFPGPRTRIPPDGPLPRPGATRVQPSGSSPRAWAPGCDHMSEGTAGEEASPQRSEPLPFGRGAEDPHIQPLQALVVHLSDHRWGYRVPSGTRWPEARPVPAGQEGLKQMQVCPHPAVPGLGPR